VERDANEPFAPEVIIIIAPPLLEARIEQRNKRYASKPNACRMHEKLFWIVECGHRIDLLVQLVKAVEYIV
jgi:hypothetical protein